MILFSDRKQLEVLFIFATSFTKGPCFISGASALLEEGPSLKAHLEGEVNPQDHKETLPIKTEKAELERKRGIQLYFTYQCSSLASSHPTPPVAQHSASPVSDLGWQKTVINTPSLPQIPSSS